jgi:hypothetical protein
LTNLGQERAVGRGELVHQGAVLLHVQDDHVQARKQQEGEQVAVLGLSVLGLLDHVVNAGDDCSVLSAIQEKKWGSVRKVEGLRLQPAKNSRLQLGARFKLREQKHCI